MEILTSVKRLYIRFKSLVNDFVYSFGRAALLLLVEVYNHAVPVRERRRIRVKVLLLTWDQLFYTFSKQISPPSLSANPAEHFLCLDNTSVSGLPEIS